MQEYSRAPGWNGRGESTLDRRVGVEGTAGQISLRFGRYEETRPLRIQVHDGTTAQVITKRGPTTILVPDLAKVHEDTNLVVVECETKAGIREVRTPNQAPLLTVEFPDSNQDPFVDFEAQGRDSELSKLLRAVAVAGFAAGNIMLLSVSVWSGAEGATRDVFHLISAIIAIPALAYSGRIFFSSAWSVLKHGRTNMDVPISIGVLLAYGMSLYDTLNHGEHAYFDAAVMLLFFLLIGRTLDHVMRERARTAVKGLARMAARGALTEDGAGSRRWVAAGEIEPGMRILLGAGDRVPVDGRLATPSCSRARFPPVVVGCRRPRAGAPARP